MADSKKHLDHGVSLSLNNKQTKNFHVLTGMLRRQVYAKCEDFFFPRFVSKFFLSVFCFLGHVFEGKNLKKGCVVVVVVVAGEMKRKRKQGRREEKRKRTESGN